MKRTPIADRIRAAYRPGITYHQLFDAVFPEADYPIARRYRTDGGPPGAAMAFGAALRRMGANVDEAVWLPRIEREART